MDGMLFIIRWNKMTDRKSTELYDIFSTTEIIDEKFIMETEPAKYDYWCNGCNKISNAEIVYYTVDYLKSIRCQECKSFDLGKSARERID